MFQNEYRRRGLTLISLVCLMLWIGQSLLLTAQDQPSYSPNKQDTPPEAGGPQTDVGPYAIPKKKEEPPPQPSVGQERSDGLAKTAVRGNPRKVPCTASAPSQQQFRILPSST